MKTKRFDFNFRPLQINVSFTTAGSVPLRQSYDSLTATHTPDYSLTPLIIQPQVSRIDRDGVLTPGEVNSALANIKWYEITGGASTLISAANPDYEITASGPEAGRVKVKKNVQPGLPVTLMFNADYVDPRTGQIFVISRSVLLRCTNASRPEPILTLDACEQTIYNPLTDPDIQTIHASVRVGPNLCDDTAERIFTWEIFRDDTQTWTAAGSDSLDYFITVNDDTATVDRSLMGDGVRLRCRAQYSPEGAPSDIPLSDASPCRAISIVRRIPRFEYDITGVPVNIPPGVLEIAPEAAMWTTKGTLDNSRGVLLPLWYIATNKASGSLSYSGVAHGANPVIPTKALSQTMGAVLALDIKDTGPLSVMQGSDGSLFEDGDGNLILIH